MNLIKIDISSASLKLKEALVVIDNIDSLADLSKLSDEEFSKYGKDLAEALAKLKKLSAEINPRINKVSDELKRYNAARQTTLFDYVEYVDADDSSVGIGFETVTEEEVDRKALDAATGLSINVTGNNLDVYTKASVRARKNRVKDAVENGTLPKEVLITTTYQQGKLVFKDPDGKDIK